MPLKEDVWNFFLLKNEVCSRKLLNSSFIIWNEVEYKSLSENAEILINYILGNIEATENKKQKARGRIDE